MAMPPLHHRYFIAPMITILWHCHGYAIMSRWLFYAAAIVMPSYRHDYVIVSPSRRYRTAKSAKSRRHEYAMTQPGDSRHMKNLLAPLLIPARWQGDRYVMANTCDDDRRGISLKAFKCYR